MDEGVKGANGAGRGGVAQAGASLAPWCIPLQAPRKRSPTASGMISQQQAVGSSSQSSTGKSIILNTHLSGQPVYTISTLKSLPQRSQQRCPAGLHGAAAAAASSCGVTAHVQASISRLRRRILGRGLLGAGAVRGGRCQLGVASSTDQDKAAQLQDMHTKPSNRGRKRVSSAGSSWVRAGGAPRALEEREVAAVLGAARIHVLELAAVPAARGRSVEFDSGQKVGVRLLAARKQGKVGVCGQHRQRVLVGGMHT